MARVAFKKYGKKGVTKMRPYVPGEDMQGISISDVDRDNGSPKKGDMVARNPKDKTEQWLVAKKYFKENYKEV
jgi:hypothetical protein